MHLVVYSKPGCPLCDEGLEVLDEVGAEITFTIEVRNILSDPGWFAKYRHLVPVVERDGRPIANLRFDARTIRAALEEKR